MKGDEFFMRRALALARRGGPRVSPNPMVGCVLTRSGRIVAEGWHARYGGPHAEAAALAKAGARARGCTAYVNLEPCCHTDKQTPPCVKALIAAGVRRVVAGTRDPNPKVSGKGLRELKKAGIRVADGVLEKECVELNRPFAVRMTEGRPYVILKAAASLDGRIEAPDGRSKWITSPQARRASHLMRAQADAVLVGVGTVLKDDPLLTSHGKGRDPVRVVLDSRLRIPRTAKILRGSAPTWVATSRRGFGRPRSLRAPVVSALRVPRNGSGLNLRALGRELLRMGVGTLLVEGGSRVHTAFLEKGLVDEVRLFLAPKLLGGRNSRSFFEGSGVKTLSRALALSDASVPASAPIS